MIFTDDLENIVEPNHVLAQQNECSTSQRAGRFSRFSRNRPKTIRQTNDSTLYLLLLVSFPVFCVTMFLSGEAEAGSAEEQPAKE
jgi:hypothetical protein